MNYLREEGIPVTGNNRVKLLMSGQEKFADLFSAIRQARHHIHLEYFNFRNDSIGDAMFDLLAEKAAEGVEVRAMFDAFGNWSNNKPLRNKHLKAIRKRGIEIVKFDPITFPYVNHVLHRDHRKIVVIDGQIGYTGGMNVADYYLNGLPKIGQWHDMHVRIEGDAVRYLQGIFLTMWNQETGQHVGGPEYFADIHIPDNMAEEVAIVDRVPRETPRSISHAYAAAIDSAKQVIRIINPYFVPTKSIRRALKNALKRNVRVEIMIPSVSDVPFTPEAALYFVHKLMKRGARIYLFNGGFHHSKVMTVDDAYCTVGTANLNSRSLRYDYETNAFIFDPHTTRQLNTLFSHDCLNSTRLTKEWWMQRPLRKKILGWFAHLFTPVL
ncbi:MAG TPA: cardiolipin synthase [Candidatus Bacteroides pullicola]|uniref:Cardiolipin synthase n=1 Tax=Candidatus Bacteroides pullicola TaxID=2838475 RepID=A0A9D1ZH60_9BACE|nr:cardiolipin synthase [Candidatus Bacteroides pullicola]